MIDINNKKRNSDFPIFSYIQIRVDNVYNRPLAYNSIESFYLFNLSKTNRLNSELLIYYRN